MTKKFSYEQTAASVLAVYKPALEVSVYFATEVSNATSVKLTTAGTTLTLTRSSDAAPGTATFSGSQIFSDHNTLNAGAPAGTYTLTISGNGTSNSGTFASYFDDAWPAPRFTNFDSLQSWNGGILEIIWQPGPDSAAGDKLVLTIARANGATVIDSSVPPLTSTLTAFSTNFIISGLTTSPGEVLYATLASSRLFSSATTLNSARVSLFKKVEVRLPIKRPTPPPVINKQPQAQTVAEGRAAIIAVSDTSINANYVWKKDGVEITAATPGFRLLQSQLLVESARRSDAGSYTVTISNAGGSVTSAPAILTVTPNLVPAFISSWPLTPPTVRIGENYTAGAQVISATPVVFRWYHDGTLVKTTTSSTSIGGVHSDALNFIPVQASDLGTYYLTATNSAGTDESPTFILAVAPLSRIKNLSILTSLSAPGDSFTLGYVLGGAYTSGPKALIIRAAGPSLAALGVAGTLDDPKLELFSGSTKTAENDNWGGSPQLANAVAAVGAFAYSTPDSRDAAISASVPAGDNSVKISAVGAGIGLVIAELYDATPDNSFGAITPRLINVSVLKRIGADEALTTGFTVGGSASRQVLIRAAGPALAAAPFNINGVNADPKLEVFSGQTVINSNDNWGGTAALSAAFIKVGAFALPSTSKDAAILLDLQPGGYTARVTANDRAGGFTLIEIYEVP